jgi:hypothetical protein
VFKAEGVFAGISLALDEIKEACPKIYSLESR